MLTFGTAAWKLSPLSGFTPFAVKCARMRTRPGRVGDVCGVSVILSSFLSYAVYPVGAGACAGGSDVACGMGGEVAAAEAAVSNSEGCAAAYGGAAGVVGGAEGESKSPRMSCAMLRWAGAAGAGAPVDADGAELPKISARRSWVVGTAG